jgi:hypothetical protein
MITPIVSRCEHCSNQRLLVARVKSELLDMKVCAECAIAAVKLQRQYACTAAEGELEIMLLPGEEICFEVIRP